MRSYSGGGSQDADGTGWREVERLQDSRINRSETCPGVNQSTHPDRSGNGLAHLSEGVLSVKARANGQINQRACQPKGLGQVGQTASERVKKSACSTAEICFTRKG